MGKPARSLLLSETATSLPQFFYIRSLYMDRLRSTDLTPAVTTKNRSDSTKHASMLYRKTLYRGEVMRCFSEVVGCTTLGVIKRYQMIILHSKN